MTKFFMYRRGDGNEGNSQRVIVSLKDDQNPYAALRALVVNDYIAGRRVRRHIIRAIEIDGEEEFGIHATVHEGPEGETAFGAAWLTAELQPITQEEAEADTITASDLFTWLDRGARTLYRKHAKEA